MLLAPDQSRERTDDIVLKRAARGKFQRQRRTQFFKLRQVFVWKQSVGIDSMPERGRPARCRDNPLAAIVIGLIGFGILFRGRIGCQVLVSLSS